MMGRGVGPGGNLDFARLRLQYCTAAETSTSRSALATKVGEACVVSMSVIESSGSLHLKAAAEKERTMKNLVKGTKYNPPGSLRFAAGLSDEGRCLVWLMADPVGDL